MNKCNLEEIKEKLERCKNIPIEDINPDDVDDIKDIKISRKNNREERILDFIMKTKNPYIFKVNGKLVRIRFSENSNLTAEDCLTNVLKNLYR